MDLQEFKLTTLGIEKEKFGKVFSFIDFGNVNYWYENDIRDNADNLLGENKKIIVDIEKLSSFVNLFSGRKMFYYGIDLRKRSTWHINKLAKDNNFNVITKPIQWVKNYLNIELPEDEIKNNKRIKRDESGFYLEMPKCNFDVELTIDALRLMDDFNTITLFSGDSDFAALLRYLKAHDKKIILFYSGRISHRIKDKADLSINAQGIKGLISSIKERTPY